MIITTAEDSFNVFRPNLDPDYDETNDAEQTDETMEESKQSEDLNPNNRKQPLDYALESDEDEDAEERRIR